MPWKLIVAMTTTVTACRRPALPSQPNNYHNNDALSWRPSKQTRVVARKTNIQYRMNDTSIILLLWDYYDSDYYYYLLIAISYSMGQIIKSVCVCLCVYPSVSTLTVAFLDRFSAKLAQT